MKKQHFKIKKLYPVLLGGFFAVLIGLLFYNNWLPTGSTSTKTIANDLQKLASVFKQIDQDCTILGFDADVVNINFLTIKKDGFVGSEVGSMMLKYPQKWNGPYLEKNPHVQGKEYQVVLTSDGYYIVPGAGVQLPNKKKVGKDIMLNEKTDVRKLISSSGSLWHKDTALAIALPVAARRCMVITEQALFAEDEA